MWGGAYGGRRVNYQNHAHFINSERRSMPQSPLDTHMQTCVIHTHMHTHKHCTHRGNCNTEHAFRLPRLKSEKCVGFCGLLCFPPPSFSLCFLLLFDFRLYGYFLFSFVSFLLLLCMLRFPFLWHVRSNWDAQLEIYYKSIWMRKLNCNQR